MYCSVYNLYMYNYQTYILYNYVNSDYNVVHFIKLYFQELDDAQVQEKIAYEYRMRDGTMKLLAACTDEAQTYEAAKNLHTINARILALMSLLQQHRAKSVIKRRKNSRYRI